MAACCTSWLRRQVSESCSTARSGSARPWPCKRHRAPASPPPAICRVESTRGRRQAGRSRGSFLHQMCSECGRMERSEIRDVRPIARRSLRPTNPGLSPQNLAQKRARAFVLGMIEEFARLVDLDDLTSIHEDDTIGDLARKAHFVSDD